MRRVGGGRSRVLPWEVWWSATVLPASRGDGMDHQTSAEAIVSAGSPRTKAEHEEPRVGDNVSRIDHEDRNRR